MKKQFKWEPYIELVDFLGDCFADNVEVVLHDLTNTEHSVIAIKNGHVTGRSIGAPLTMFALKAINEMETNNQSKITNYKGIIPNGKELRSSSFFIKNEKGDVVGVLCINIDITDYQKAAELLNKLSYIQPPQKSEKDEIKESFPSSIRDLTMETLKEVLNCEDFHTGRLNMDEKMNIVEQLKQKGLFQIKGAVSEVAYFLSVSEATIYRYLNTISKKAQR